MSDFEDGERSRPFRPFFRAKSARFTEEAARRPILMFEDVYKSYRPGAPVLRGMNLVIERGEFVFVTGPSGAGKSTLLRLLYRAERVDEGRILFLGRDVARLTDTSVPFLRRNVGVVYQDFKLVPTWTVYENVCIALEVLGVAPRHMRARVGEALDRVGLTGRGNEVAGVLSGGEQQRVAIARAVANAPLVLLADEPTGNLDPRTAEHVFETLMTLVRATGLAAVIATHNFELAARMDRRITLRDGQIVELE